MTCPTCGGSGAVDTTPAGARHPALTSDAPCPDCREHRAAADRSGLPHPPRHRGVTLPDGAPERWEVAGDG